MIQPALQDDAFLVDVASARADPAPDRLHLWWLGQSGFLLSHAGRCLLFNPYLSDSLTKKYAATDKPHVRMTARVVDPVRLALVDVVTSSHNHTDHFDAETLAPIFAASPRAKFVLPAANFDFALQRLGPSARRRLIPLADRERAMLGPFTLEAVPAAHEQLAPEFAGFVVSVGRFRIYHSGDTVLFPGMAERLRPFRVDLALLPINGRAPERRVSGNLDGPEAARLAHAIGARCVVPCHYEMFAFNTASPAGFVAECARLPQRCVVLRAGERLSLESGTMTFVRTVLGDIPAADLGVCYAHEHVIIDRSFTTHLYPDFLLADVARAVPELRRFHAAGGRAMIDSMPCDSGRNVLKLAALSRQSGVHLVCPTGLHLAKYYPPGHWGEPCTEDELAALFSADINDGVDAHDYGGPRVQRTTHRAGVIKIATGRTLTPREEKLFAAAAQAHRATGCPILTHTEQGELAFVQIDRLRRSGVDLRHVCLSHIDRKPDLAYHRDVLATGVRVEYDSAFRWPAGKGNPTRDLLLALLPEFPDQIMLGMDAARQGYWRTYGGAPGLEFLLTDFTAQLRAAGLSDGMWQRMFVSTPAATFSFLTVPR